MVFSRKTFLLLLVLQIGLLGLDRYSQTIYAKPLVWNAKVGAHPVGGNFILDPYRSFSQVYFSLTPSPPFYIYNPDEPSMYRQIWRQAQHPTHLLLEVTAYPLAWLTADLHQYHASVYQLFNVGKNLNLLSSLAGGEREPYSLSLFCGQILSFVYLDEMDSLRYTPGGVCGWVLTKGWFEIFDNYIVQADWYRLEWKFRGGIDNANMRHKWEIKIGYRWYGLPWINDDVLLAFKREKFSPVSKAHNWYDNSRMEWELHLPPADLPGGWSYVKFLYGKVYPYRNYLLGASLGICYERRRIFEPRSGTARPLLEQPQKSIWSFICQPMLIRW